MIDKHITVDSIRWHRVLPWLHLLRAMQLCCRVRQVLLAMLAMLLLAWGVQSLTPMLFRDAKPDQFVFWKLMEHSGPHDDGVPFVSSFWKQSLMWIVRPWETVTAPAARLFETGNSWTSVAAAWTNLLWSLLVWAIFGGAITRIAAMRFARDESVSICAALKFSARSWQSYIYGPLLPMLVVGILALVGGSVGWMQRWWGPGTAFLEYLGFLPLLCGLVMALLLGLMTLSWPLMVAAISVEGSDGFDGLSRAFGYVMNRPWYFAFLVWLALLIGAATHWIVQLVKGLAIHLAGWSCGVTIISDFGIWRSVAEHAALAVMVSYFWSATTVIYFLLRQSDDGTPLDEVYIPGPPPKPEPLPLVGVAASQQPVIERPATEPAVTDSSSVPPSDS